MVEPVTAGVVRSVDEIPTLCVEDDLIAIFRLTSREMRLWRKFPEFIPFPPLPMLDRQIRVSGCVVAWFLAQESAEYCRAFKAPLAVVAQDVCVADDAGAGIHHLAAEDAIAHAAAISSRSVANGGSRNARPASFSACNLWRAYPGGGGGDRSGKQSTGPSWLAPWRSAEVIGRPC
jgi:hypothetical protein